MTTGQEPRDEGLAYVEAPAEQRPLEHDMPFRAEAPKRRNMRLLVGAAVVIAVLIGVMFIGGQVYKTYRANAAERRAAQEKVETANQAQTRRGREFPQEVGPATVEPAAPPAPAASLPPIPQALASGGPLPSGQPPLPASYPSTAGQVPQSQPAPPPPSMMLSSTTSDNAASAAAQAAALIAKQTPTAGQGDSTVQAMAHAQAAGKPPTGTAQSLAAKLGDRSFVLAKGSWIPCVLETQLDSSVPGNTSCVIPEDVYSDDGKALLVEKGSRGQGTFGNTLKVGDQRIAIMWNRIKTTKGIVIDVESPTSDGVGTSGAGGYIDNHWMDRIGAAVLLSFVEDGLAYAVAQKQDNGAQQPGANIYLPSNSIQSSKRLSEKILDATINIPPTLYKNRGDRIMIYVNRDLWFDKTYKLVRSE